MCIVLATTAHPSYALIVLDNRDEFILRPTSRPHWWSSPHELPQSHTSSSSNILSSRDLQRAEQGTWLGITRHGNFAVLTNYRETDMNNADHPVQGTRSRGAMVTAWLTAPESESTNEFVSRLHSGDGVKGVGGFSLLCGKLRRCDFEGRKEIEPLVIVSNRSEGCHDVPHIARCRGEVYGLSNTSYGDPEIWPKVKMGKANVLKVVEQAVDGQMAEEELVQKLWGVLDTDTLPRREGMDFEYYIEELRKSIFIPSINDTVVGGEIPKAEVIASASTLAMNDAHTDGTSSSHFTSELSKTISPAKSEIIAEERPDPSTFDGMSGPYGTQRQTIILVNWEGKVTFIERSLFDSQGRHVPRGQGDMRFGFDIKGWRESKL